MNCCVLPAATDAVAGVTAIEVNTAAVTVRLAVFFTVPRLAVMVAVPAATPLASPVWRPIVAMEVLDEIQLTLVVMFCVELSL